MTTLRGEEGQSKKNKAKAKAKYRDPSLRSG
jgi:hypothetical protein